MEIQIYNKAKHGEIIQNMLFNDKEGASLCGINGVCEIEEDCTFWAYKVVLIQNDNIIGYCFCGSADGIQNSVFINELYIRKNFRGRGYSKLLLLNVIEYYKYLNITKVKLKVYSQNKVAIHTYKSLGFKNMGVHKEADLFGDLEFYHLDLIKK